MKKSDQRKQYIEENNLFDSFIDEKKLFQYRGVLPKRMNVGTTDKGHKVFFEESAHSLMQRKYGYKDKVVGWNLVYYDGNKTELVTKDYLQGNRIDFNEGFNLDKINYYLDNKITRNALSGDTEKKIKYCFCVKRSEVALVKEFLKRLRAEK